MVCFFQVKECRHHYLSVMTTTTRPPPLTPNDPSLTLCMSVYVAAYVKLLQEVDDVRWLQEHKVDFFLCDQLWVQSLLLPPTDSSRTTPVEHKTYCSIISAGVEAGAELRSMDWAVQCFIHRYLVSPTSSPRYGVAWPNSYSPAAGGTTTSSGSSKKKGGLLPLLSGGTTGQVYYCKYDVDRYEVGDVVKVASSSSYRNHPSPEGRGGGSNTSSSGVQYGRIKAIHLVEGGGNNNKASSSTLDIQMFEQSNAKDSYELMETTTSSSGTTTSRVEIVRLRGKIVLVEKEGALYEVL